MNYCSNCGQKINGAFCSGCGSKVGAPVESAQQNESSPVQSQPQPQPNIQANDIKDKALKILTDAETKTNMHKQRLVIAIVAGIAFICQFFPWVTVSGHMLNGFNVPSLLILIAVIVICLLGNKKELLNKKPSIAVSVLGGVHTIIMIANMVDTNTTVLRGRSESLNFFAYFSVLTGLAICALPFLFVYLEKKKWII